jgi:DNA-binding MarR family transcriptional regulator
VPHANKESRQDDVALLDHTLQRMRRVVLRPPGAGIPIPGLGRRIDIAKILACEAIADLAADIDPVTVTDVALALQLERSTVSRLVGECESEGLLMRTAVPGDGRRVGLAVTEDGLRAVAGSAELRADFLQTVTERFSDTELRTLVQHLDRFADALSETFPHWLDRANTPAAPQ